MAYLKKANAPKNELDEKTADLATALERVASGQADLAQFEKAEKNGLEALALRRGLPEEMPERKLEESLNSLARMYANNIGDLRKAREYYRKPWLASKLLPLSAKKRSAKISIRQNRKRF